MPRTLKIAAQVVIAELGSAARVVTAFRALGFTCGEVVGNSFSIEAAPSVFQQVFGVSPEQDSAGRMRERTKKGKSAAARPLSELPADKLPETLRPLVKGVIFSEPPAFGPGHVP